VTPTASFLTGILSLFLVPVPFDLYGRFLNREDVYKNFLQSAQTNPYNSWRYISGDDTLHTQQNESLQNDSMVSATNYFNSAFPSI
jgi:hypothetical protein